MSNQITKNGKPINKPLFGSTGEIKTVFIKSSLPLTAKDDKGRFQDIEISALSSYGNRDTEVKNIKKIVKNGNGIDGETWQPPLVAHVVTTDEHLIYDGDHSFHIWKESNPHLETIPVQVRKVQNRNEVHKLFVQRNSTCRINITAEQIFVNDVLYGEPQALETRDMLCASGLYVYCSSEPVGRAGDTAGYKVKIGGAREAFKLAGSDTKSAEKYVKPAVRIISNMRHFDRSVHIIQNELLQGLTMVLKAYPKLLKESQPGGSFHQWFQDVTKRRKVRDFVIDLKTRGGGHVNESARCIAQGILDYLREDSTFKSIRVKDLYRIFP